MVYLFYNKILLRVLVALAGLGIGIATFHYISLSAEKLPEQGARDALAIISFLIAGWLVMLIAEVVDNHYVRVFGALCVGLGAYVSYPWIFLKDGPSLQTLEGAPQRLAALSFGFWAAVVIAAIMLILLVTRLIMDRIAYGRMPAGAAARIHDADLGPRPSGVGEPPRPDALPPIPVDNAPLAVTTDGVALAAPATRTVGPVRRLSAIGGVYMGTSFDLAPGSQFTVGRQGADLTLADDAQVSRTHAVLVVDAGGMASVQDQGSTNGTFLNNQRVQEAQLAPGDVLRIGTTQFKVEA
jgi:MFS family permease